MSKAAMNLAVAKYAAQYKDEGLVFLSISPGLVKTKAGCELPYGSLSLHEFRLTYPLCSPFSEGRG